MRRSVQNLLHFLGLSAGIFSSIADVLNLDQLGLDPAASTSSDGFYAVSGAFTQPEAVLMTGSGFSVRGEFTGFVVPTAESLSEVIFDNTGRSTAGLDIVSPDRFFANRFCLNSEDSALESVTLRLSSRDLGKPVLVRLRIYTNDPATGRPGVDVGAVMELSGATNPITFAAEAGSTERSVQWKPAAPVTLLGNRCYWVVFNIESGEVLYSVTFVPPFGSAAAQGRTSSSDGGRTWSVVDTAANRQMVIRARPGGVAALAPLKVTTVTGVPEGLLVTVGTNPGLTYLVQSRLDFSNAVWIDVPGSLTLASSSTLTFVLPTTEKQQFYRFRQGP